jgi:predicted transglutaminase-like cysteine proteinase
MFRFVHTRRSAWVTVCVALAFGSVSPALAKKAVRGAGATSFAAADLIAIPKFSSTSAPSVGVTPPQGPARFFTINAAMAKRDGHPASTAVRLATSTPADSLSDVIQPVPAAIAQGDEPFGMQAFKAPEGALWFKWRALAKELQEDEARLRSCQADPQSCSAEQTRFWALAAQIKTSAGRAQLEKVNQLVNSAIVYASDMAMHGQMDRWSSPLATLKLGKGDCEDYAILKYKLLLEAGVRASDLRIVLVRDTSVRIDHAVLTARAGGRWYVLDNRKSGFYAEGDLPHYLPLFALDQDGVKLFAAPFALLPAVDDSVLPGLSDETGASPFAGTLPILL